MEIIVGPYPTKFNILKKSYKAFNGCLFIQVRFVVEHNQMHFVYVLSCLFDEDRQTLFINCEEKPEEMDTAEAIDFGQNVIGLKRIFRLFKEEIFEMVENTLHYEEYAYLRLLLLPL